MVTRRGALLGLSLGALTLTGCASEFSEEGHCLPPAEATAVALDAWLSTACFLSWDAESRVLEATKSDSHAQIFINPTLRDSLMSQRVTHPPGSMAVRVIYLDDKVTLWGHAVSLKARTGDADAWFWFERFEDQEGVKTASSDAPGCTGCHGSGVDFVHSAWPLR